MQDQDEQPQDPFAVRKVGKGWRAAARNYANPQEGLIGSNHPYSPFTGNALKWESYVFDDATTYEGLTREGIPHGKGVLRIGNATGGGFQFPDRGDRYDGEFFGGFAHGLGAYQKMDGRVYKGEFTFGRRHGCGVERNMMPWFKLLEKGVEPAEAWLQVKDEINRSAKKGTWQKDFFRKATGKGGCETAELEGTEEEVEEVVAKVRMFEYKPDGDVTFMMVQDEQGFPAPIFQDPLHYPHGTGFLAPGPMGQCWPIPDDPALRKDMEVAARNHERIFKQYNLPYDVEPGSDLAAAIEMQLRREIERMEKAQRRAELEKRRLKRLEKKAAGIAEKEETSGAKGGLFGRKKAPPPPPKEEDDEDDGGDISDDDLVASTAAVEISPEAAGTAAGQDLARRLGGLPPPTVFASMSLGVNSAAGTALQSATRLFHNFSVRAAQRRSLARPLRR